MYYNCRPDNWKLFFLSQIEHVFSVNELNELTQEILNRMHYTAKQIDPWMDEMIDLTPGMNLGEGEGARRK